MKKIITLLSASLFSICAFAQWDTLHTGTYTYFNAISFCSHDTGVAVGKDPGTLRGAAYQTTDGGNSWWLVSSGTPSYNDIYFTGFNRGWIAADSGYILETTNNGMTWGTWAHIGSTNFNCIMFPTDTVGYVGGDNGVLYRTSDFGATWDTLNSETNLSINDIYFVNELSGWIVGDGGYMAATSDGGQTWTTVIQPYVGFLQCSGFAYSLGNLNAYVVGNDGAMIQSTDAGFTWSVFSSGTSANLNSIRFGNDLAGIICGDNGMIHRTYNGGLNWANESMPYVTQDLNGICFAGDTIAYICGDSGRVVKSHFDISAVHAPVQNAMSVAAFPNPFSDVLNIVLDLENASDVQLKIMDMAGRIVLEENEGTLAAGKHTINPQGISALATGMYFVSVQTTDGGTLIPLIKH